MKLSHHAVTSMSRNDPSYFLCKVTRRNALLVKAASLLIAITFCLNISSVNADDDAALLSEIRNAWQARQDHAKTLYARWIRFEEKRVNPGLPPDPLADELRFESLTVSNQSLRFEHDKRRWDIDGGPGGSSSWMTTTCIEAFNPQDGWCTVLDCGLKTISPSVTVNRPEMKLDSMSGRYVLLLWYRGLDENLSLSEFASWRICHNSELIHPDGNIVTIMSGEAGRNVFLLFLDPSLGFLPIGSRDGSRPAENSPLLTYRECTVSVDPDSTPVECRPVGWTTHICRPSEPLSGIEVCRIQDFRIGAPITSAVFHIEHPAGVPVFDDSVQLQANIGILNPSGDEVADDTSKHGWHFGYYMASLFAILLAGTVIWNRRGSQRFS